MRGTMDIDCFFFEGIDGYISMCGHTAHGQHCVEEGQKISGRAGQFHLVHDRHNVYLLDCGCGFAGGRHCLSLSGDQKSDFTPKTGRGIYVQELFLQGGS